MDINFYLNIGEISPVKSSGPALLFVVSFLFIDSILTLIVSFFSFLFFFFCLFAISWAAPTAYGGSQARGPIGAVATGLQQSHSNAGSELRLQPTPQLMATLDC